MRNCKARAFRFKVLGLHVNPSMTLHIVLVTYFSQLCFTISKIAQAYVFATGGKINMANCLVGHRQAGLKKNVVCAWVVIGLNISASSKNLGPCITNIIYMYIALSPNFWYDTYF